MLQVLLIWFVPESPRYLVSKGKDAQALKTLAYYHADGNAEDPLVRYEFEEIKAAIEFDQTGLFFFSFFFSFFRTHLSNQSLQMSPGSLLSLHLATASA